MIGSEVTSDIYETLSLVSLASLNGNLLIRDLS